jgi:hypothetical protein
MNWRGVCVGTLLLGSAMLAACGDDDDGAPGGSSGSGGSVSGSAGETSEGGDPALPSAGKTSGGSGGTGGSSGGTGGSGGIAGSSAGEAGAGGTPEPEPTFVSNPVGVQPVLDAEAEAAGYRLVSSNLTQKSSGATNYYKEWWAEIKNGTSEPQCYIELDADFQSATGTSLLKLHTYAYGGSFDTGTTTGLVATCAAPGETVPIWSNALDATMVPLSSIAKVSITVAALERPDAVAHPSTPTLSNVQKSYDAGLQWWQFSATATATADVYNLKTEFWGKSKGLIVGKSAGFHSGDLLKGQTWQVATIAGIDSTTLDSFTPYVSFIDGLSGALRVRYDAATRKLVDVQQLARSSWKAADERQALAH